jgi:hypothetical protein
MDEFGGESSQILFEHVPDKMDFLPNSCESVNQFIFPHRILCNDLETSSEALPATASSSRNGKRPPVEGQTKQRVAFGKVLPANAPSMAHKGKKL